MHKAVPMQLLVSNDALTAELYIMGDIRRGSIWDSFDESGDARARKTDSLDVVRALSKLPASVGGINVHINSFGGEVAEGLAIYNALKAHQAKVMTYCEGFACSIASVVFMAGDERIMRDSSLLMVHNPSLYAGGTADELRKAADGLDAIREASITAYMAHATCGRDEIASLMDDETWLGPERSVELGLATSVDPGDEDDEPTQDARRCVLKALTGPAKEVLVARVQVSAEEIADEIMGRLEGLMPTQADPDNTEGHINIVGAADEAVSQKWSRTFLRLAGLDQ